MKLKRPTTKQIRRAAKNHPYFAGLLAVLIISLSIVGAVYIRAKYGSYFVGGGSVWQFDYHFSKLQITGGQGNTAQTYTSGLSPYEWGGNIDGNYDPNTGAGRSPAVVVTVGIVGRVDKNGNNLTYNAQDPQQESYVASGRTYCKYYYMFDVKMATASQVRTNIYGIPGCEYGMVDITATVTVTMDKSIFASSVDGHYGDARVHQISMTDPLYNDQYAYWEYAKIDPIQDIGDGIAFSAPVTTNLSKAANLIFHSTLTCGAVRAGFLLTGSLPYDVWIVKRCKVTMLLSAPLAVGDISKIQPFNPPPEGLPWWLPWLIVALIVLIIIVVAVAYVMAAKYKAAGSAGRHVSRAFKRKKH